MVSAFGFGPRGSVFESSWGLGIFSAEEVVSTRSEDVVSPLVRQFQPTPTGFTATHNHSGGKNHVDTFVGTSE